MVLLPALPLLHLVAGAVILAASGRLGRWCLAVAAVPMAAAVVGLGIESGPVLDGSVRGWSGGWVGGLGIGLTFDLDGFAWLLGLIVAGVGLLVLGYAARYFDGSTSAKDLGTFAGLFVAFGGAMLGLVLADDVWTLFVFWEATSVLSFLLIGLDHEGASTRAAALRALLVTGAGGLAMLGGFAILAAEAGSSSLAAIGAVEVGPLIEVALVLVLVGAFTKSAQVPFHFWLPGAMAAPTPVSAYLHSATMVKAGVILVAHLAPAFGGVRWWAPLLVLVGTTTMVVGGLRALRQHDAKLLLAHGTVSQLGLLMILFGIGIPDVTAAAVAVLVAHAAFKAALFLVVGIVDHATGTRDLRRLQGVGRALPWVAGLAAVAGASMAGLPPLLGFVAKEAALAALLDAPGGWATAAVAGVGVGSVLTVAYTVRLWVGLFGDRVDAAAGAPASVHHRPSTGLVAPAVVLVGVTIAGGLAAGPLGERLEVAGQALDPAAHGHLVLWPGPGVPLLVSAVIVGVGLLLAWGLARRPLETGTGGVSAEATYQGMLDGLLGLSRRVAAVVQNGSLPSYLLVVLAVVAAALGGALVGGVRLGDAPLVAADSVPQAVVAVLVGSVALGVAMARRRFLAVLLLGGVGYGLALLFFLAGAPDLALTQMLVETVVVVVFLLVLRQLPEGYTPPPSWAPAALRLGLAAAIGVTMTAFVLVAGTARTEAPVTEEIMARSEPEAGGRNVVNVILVDFRAMDTLGEITVLALGALGVANLVRSARRDAGRRRSDEDRADELADAPGGRGDRSVVLDEVTRVLVPVLLVVSVYVTFRGHNAPGGGFAGGLLAGVALLLRFLATGQPTLGRLRTSPAVLLAIGLVVAAGTGLFGLVDGQLLESAMTTVELPVVGSVKLVSSTAFDVGVYLVVVGAVLATVSNLGADVRGRAPREALR